jgi:hypothetical protein
MSEARCMHKGFAGLHCRRQATKAINVYDASDFRKEHPTHLEFCQSHMDRLFPDYPQGTRTVWLDWTQASRWRQEVVLQPGRAND